MAIIDKRIDAYIEKSADFAKPILRHVRELIHQACPDVTETLKWGMPSFEYKGLLCGFAAFKHHCTFSFWKHSLLEDKALPKERTGIGSFGRMTSLKDLPSDRTLKKLIHDAMKLNEDGISVKRPVSKKKALVVPDILKNALKIDSRAEETFNNFPPSCKREYVEWITEAKTDATRERRLATTLEWLVEGKRRHWKYEKC